jgi:hypothetical protein
VAGAKKVDDSNKNMEALSAVFTALPTIKELTSNVKNEAELIKKLQTKIYNDAEKGF